MDLSKFATNDDAPMEKDTLGGYLRDSDAELWTIKHAYLSESDKGALAVNLHATNTAGEDYKETIYFTNRNKQTTYTRNDKVYHLPGFNLVEAIALLGAGCHFSELSTEEKVIPVWDYDAGKELPKTVEVLSELSGVQIILGILRIIEDKTALNDATEKYEPTGETFEVNHIDKVFRDTDRCTVSEVMAELEEGEFIVKWLDKNKGKVIDKSKGKAQGSSGVKSGMPTAEGNKKGKGKSLFTK